MGPSPTTFFGVSFSFLSVVDGVEGVDDESGLVVAEESVLSAVEDDLPHPTALSKNRTHSSKVNTLINL